MSNNISIDFDKSTIDQYILKLYNTIKNSGYKIDCVVGIATGGLYISKPLAELLKADHKTIKISFYGNGQVEKQKIPSIDYMGSEFDTSKRYLLVDDLIDSGSTIDYFLKKHVELKVMTAVLFWKRNNDYDVVPNFYAAIKPEGWINFYWEKSS